MEPKQYDWADDWEDDDGPTCQDDFYDDLAHWYLHGGEVWPEGLTLERLPKLEASLRIADFFEDLAPELDK